MGLCPEIYPLSQAMDGARQFYPLTIPLPFSLLSESTMTPLVPDAVTSYPDASKTSHSKRNPEPFQTSTEACAIFQETNLVLLKAPNKFSLL